MKNRDSPDAYLLGDVPLQDSKDKAICLCEYLSQCRNIQEMAWTQREQDVTC